MALIAIDVKLQVVAGQCKNGMATARAAVWSVREGKIAMSDTEIVVSNGLSVGIRLIQPEDPEEHPRLDTFTIDTPTGLDDYLTSVPNDKTHPSLVEECLARLGLVPLPIDIEIDID